MLSAQSYSASSLSQAIHARITSKRRVQRGRYVRHDVEIFTTYKSDFKLMSREYVWSTSTCCPKLRPYRHYLLIGRKIRVDITGDQKDKGAKKNPETARRFQTRLFVEHTDYWHPWKKRYESKMAKLSKNINCERHG